jgi:spore coat protein CotH
MFGKSKRKKKIKKEPFKIIGFIFSLLAVILVGIFVFSYSRGVDKWVIITKIPPGLRDVGRETLKFFARLPYIKYEFASHNLPIYDLQVDRDDLDFLRTHLPEPTEQMTEEYKVYVPAKFTDENEEEYEVEIRNRGVSKNHWLWDKKSMRVKFDSKNLYNGIQHLNFILPLDRVYLVEEFNNYRAKRLGLTVPRSYFAVVKINGKDPAVYWAIEHYDKEFLETAQLSSDANFYGESDEYTNTTSYKDLYASVFNWKKYNEDVRFHKDNFVEIDLLEYLIHEASEDEFRKNIFSIVDKDNFYAWNIHNLLAFGQHQDWEHNVRAYFDSSMGKFKFIPVDVVMGDITVDAGNSDFFEEHSNILMNKILAYPDFMIERNKRLWEYVGDDKNLQAELEYYDKLYQDTKVAFYQDKIRRFTNQHFDSMVAEYRGKIISNTQILRAFFEQNNAFAKVDFNNNNRLNLFLGLKSLSPFVIEKIEINGDGDKNVNLIDEGGNTICVGTDVLLHCNENTIFPNTYQVQLPSPEAIYPRVNDYYKAFTLDEVVAGYSLVSEANINWVDMEIKIFIKNLYTEDIVEMII